MGFQLVLDIDITPDTEKDFFDEIITQNEGEAIQALAAGKRLGFENVTDQQKKDFVVTKLAQQFANIYQNAKLEREVNEFRQHKLAERGAK